MVTWSAPSDTGGLTITGYIIEFREDDGTTYSSSSLCDGTSTAVISARSCTIAMTEFTGANYLLDLNDPVIVRIKATNVFGDSTNYSPDNTV